MKITSGIFAGAKLAGIAFLMAGPSKAADGKVAVDLEVGAEYDDNITIDSIDSNSRQGDSMLRINGAFGVQLFEKNETGFNARYSFFQSLHRDLTEFDLQIHGLSGRLKSKIGKINVGADYRYDHIRLAGNGFLNAHTVGTDIGLLVAKQTYLTAGYEFRHQSFADPARSERNADRHSVDAKLYFLLGDGENITTGYRVSRQTAGIDSLSYWGHTFDASYKRPVTLGSTIVTARIRYQYRHKDYSAVDPQIGAERSDKRHTIRFGIDVPLSDRVALGAEYKYVASISNLQTVDYNGNSIRASLSWSF